ncbi:MAG: GAF and ANTAR domain-containing protein [Nocardioidaceae bacterium]
MERRTELAARFAGLSQSLLGSRAAPVSFELVARRAVEVVPGCNWASITLLRRGHGASSVASTGTVPTQLDELQVQLGEGPSLDAARDRAECVSPDLTAESRWPAWSPEARRLGIGSVVSVPLHTDKEILGALNLYATGAGVFDTGALDIAAIYAIHALSELEQAKLVSGLKSAMQSRHIIGIAQGVLAVRYGIAYDTAFEVLRRLSNELNIKLRDLAQQVADQRGLPDSTHSEPPVPPV